MKAFDRSLACGPWRVLPVPAFLSDRRSGVRFQLAWAAGLAILLVLAVWLAHGSEGRVFEPRSLPLIWSQSLPTMLVGVGMAVVVARGGFDASTGAVSVLAGLVAAHSGSATLAILTAVGCGLVNGVLVAAVRAPGWLITPLTMLIVNALTSRAGPSLMASRGSFGWMVPAMSVVVPLVAIAALATWQLRPAASRARTRLRERLEDGWPYVLSAALAGVAGVYLVGKLGMAMSRSDPSRTWLEMLVVVVLGGTYLGSGRANVLGTMLAALGLSAWRYAAVVAYVAGYVQALALVPFLFVSIAVSALLHWLLARRYLASRASTPAPAVAAAEPGGEDRPRRFDRDLFHGPGRILPIPIHLADRRWALRLELLWSVPLALGAAVLAGVVASGYTQGGGFDARILTFTASRAVPALLVVLGASVVVARGGFDASAAALAGVAGTLAARDGSVVRALLVAAGIGLVNGVAVGLVRIPGLLASFVSLLGLQVFRLLQLYEAKGLPETIPTSPELAWVHVAGLGVLAVGAAGAFAWVQLLPGRSPGKAASPRQERFADGLAYVFSSLLACVAGIYLVQLVGAATPQLGLGGELVPALVIGGCWLGAGRANVIGALLATGGLVILQDLFAVANAPPDTGTVPAVMAGLMLLGLVASRVVHLRVGAAYARSADRVPEAEGVASVF